MLNLLCPYSSIVYEALMSVQLTALIDNILYEF